MSIIKVKREEIGLTQKQVANFLKLSQPAYYKIENGQTKMRSQLKKKIMQILDLKEADLETKIDNQTDADQYRQLQKENSELISELIEKEEVLNFFIQHFEMSNKKQEFISSLWIYVQDISMIKYPEKYKKISEWCNENQELIMATIDKGLMPESCYPAHIKKLDNELENIRMYFIEKAMYNSKIFRYLKEKRLLNKKEINYYNNYRKIDPKMVK